MTEPLESVVDETRGVSEVVGFILVFSLILGTITIVYTGGFEGLSNTRDVEEVNNAERAFDILAENIDKIARGEAPNRATEVKQSGGQLQIGEDYRVVVSDSDDDTEDPEHDYWDIHPITYDPAGSDERLTYEMGAVIRSGPAGATMVREPDFIVGPDQSVLRFVRTTGDVRSVSGDTTTLIRAQREGEGMIKESDDDTETFNVTIETHPEHTDVWEEYLRSTIHESYEDYDGECRTESENSVECHDLETEKLYVGYVEVEISLS